LDELNGAFLIFDEDSGCQRTAEDRCGVDVDTVLTNIWPPGYRRMAVNQKPTESLFGGKEGLPNPEEVMRVLMGERPIGIDAGVNEEPLAVIE
jgi:hypothetical protein